MLETSTPLKLTNTFRDVAAPRAVVFAGDERIADDFVAALASVLGEGADPVRLDGTGRVLVRSYQRPSVHPIVARHRQDAVSGKHRLGASNLLALRSNVAPLTRLEAGPAGDSIQPVGAGAAVSHLRFQVRRVLQVFDGSEWNRRQRLAVDNWKRIF